MTAPDLIDAWRRHYAEQLAEVPYFVFQGLEHALHLMILDARSQGNVPLNPIAEDGKRGRSKEGVVCPKR